MQKAGLQTSRINLGPSGRLRTLLRIAQSAYLGIARSIIQVAGRSLLLVLALPFMVLLVAKSFGAIGELGALGIQSVAGLSQADPSLPWLKIHHWLGMGILTLSFLIPLLSGFRAAPGFLLAAPIPRWQALAAWRSPAFTLILLSLAVLSVKAVGIIGATISMPLEVQAKLAVQSFLFLFNYLLLGSALVWPALLLITSLGGSAPGTIARVLIFVLIGIPLGTLPGSWFSDGNLLGLASLSEGFASAVEHRGGLGRALVNPALTACLLTALLVGANAKIQPGKSQRAGAPGRSSRWIFGQGGLWTVISSELRLYTRESRFLNIFCFIQILVPIGLIAIQGALGEYEAGQRALYNLLPLAYLAACLYSVFSAFSPNIDNHCGLQVLSAPVSISTRTIGKYIGSALVCAIGWITALALIRIVLGPESFPPPNGYALALFLLSCAAQSFCGVLLPGSRESRGSITESKLAPLLSSFIIFVTVVLTFGVTSSGLGLSAQGTLLVRQTLVLIVAGALLGAITRLKVKHGLRIN